MKKICLLFAVAMLFAVSILISIKGCNNHEQNSDSLLGGGDVSFDLPQAEDTNGVDLTSDDILRTEGVYIGRFRSRQAGKLNAYDGEVLFTCTVSEATESGFFLSFYCQSDGWSSRELETVWCDAFVSGQAISFTSDYAPCLTTNVWNGAKLTEHSFVISGDISLGENELTISSIDEYRQIFDGSYERCTGKVDDWNRVFFDEAPCIATREATVGEDSDTNNNPFICMEGQYLSTVSGNYYEADVSGITETGFYLSIGIMYQDSIWHLDDIWCRFTDPDNTWEFESDYTLLDTDINPAINDQNRDYWNIRSYIIRGTLDGSGTTISCGVEEYLNQSNGTKTVVSPEDIDYNSWVRFFSHIMDISVYGTWVDAYKVT